MDIETMHIAVKLELDKSSALELPAFEPEEIDYWLNVGIKKFTKTRYSGMNVKRESFEETQKRLNDLRTLVENDVLDLSASTTYVSAGGYSVDDYPPSDYWFTLAEEVDITVGTTTTRVGVTECTHNEYSRKKEDPYAENLLHYGSAKPLRLVNLDSVELIGDGTNYTIDNYYLTYLKEPQTVALDEDTPLNSIDCDLPEHTHDEIIKLTVQMMLENIEQPRYNTYNNEVLSME